MLALNFGHWQFWGIYNPNEGLFGEQKCVFDGPNRVIYVAKGVTEIDVQDDIYSAWKEWVLGSTEFPAPSNWPRAISSIGGDPITDTQNVGITYFLENGWRIQPAESSTNYLLTVDGNIYTREPGQNPFLFAQGCSVNVVRSNLVDIVGGGTGGGADAQAIWEYTTRTLTSPSGPTADQVASAVWDKTDTDHNTIGSMGHLVNDIRRINQKIFINTENVANGVGSQEAPYNNLTDAIDAAEISGITTLNIVGDVILDRNVKNFYIEGTGVPEFDCNGFNVNNSHFKEVRFKGQYTGSVVVRDSVLVNDSWLNGFFENCALGGNLFCLPNAEVFMKNVASAIPGTNRPTISMNAGTATLLSVRGYHGGLTIKDADNVGDLCTVELDAGSLTFDSSCVLGTLVARGIGKFVDESNGATVIDETLNRELFASNIPIIADAVWDETAADHLAVGSLGEVVQSASGLDEAELHIALNNYGNFASNIKEVNDVPVTSVDDFKSDNVTASVDFTPVLNAIAALNDITLAEIEASNFLAKDHLQEQILNAIAALNDISVADIVAENQIASKIEQVNIKNLINALSYPTLPEIEASTILAKQSGFQPILNAIAALNDLSLLEIENSTVIAKDAAHQTIAAAIAALNDLSVADIEASTILAKEASVLNNNSAIAALNDITLTEIEASTVIAKRGVQDSILNSIAALNDLTVADIEASTILARESTLSTIANSIALIPTTDSVADLTPVLTAISNLNDVTPLEVRAAFNAVDFQDKNTEAEIHAWLDTYTNKTAWMGSFNGTVNLQPILDAIAELNDIAVADIEASTTIAKEATLTSIQSAQTTIQALINGLNDISVADIEASPFIAKQSTLGNIQSSIDALPTTDLVADLTPVLSAISNLNDVTAAEVRAAFNENEFKDQISQAELHAWLDTYTNKDDWKQAPTSLLPVLSAIGALNDITVADIEASIILAKEASVNNIVTLGDIESSLIIAKESKQDTILTNISAIDALTLTDIEGSTILSKEATLVAIANAIAAIPTTDSVADLTPVLSAITSLNDVTPAEVRAAFNVADFKDKNTEIEIHAWLDTYVNKDAWKGLTTSQEAKITDTNIVVNAVSTSINNVNSTVNTLPTLSDIEGSTVLAKSAELSVIDSIINSLPQLSEIRDEMINVQFGGLEIANNQLTIKDKSGVVIAIFDLFDKNGNPTMLSVYKRNVVQ